MSRPRFLVGMMAVAALSAGLPAPARASAALRVIPFPGTPDAAASSQVIFSALRPAQLRSVTVIGSRSGRHRGRLAALPAGAGTAFTPDRPFTPGETVHVSATAARGGPAISRLSYSFRVAVPATPLTPPGNGLRPQSWMSPSGFGPTQSFHSERNLHPPVVTLTADPDQTSGDIFLTAQNSPQVGPMLLGSSGQVVWFDPLHNGSTSHLAANLSLQHYQGQPVLTWWQGRVVGGLERNPSEDVIMDRSYRKVAVVRAGNGYVTDQHDFQITPRGTALLEATTFSRANLRSVGGPSTGSVLDDVIQEVDVKTGRVLWEWHALGHVPLRASYLAYNPHTPFYDFFHLNSIQQLPNGNLLISARDTCALYEISRQTGKVIWTMGGRYSDFRMGPGATFWYQHDARLHGHTLSVFDDAAYPQMEAESSAKFLRVDSAAHTVSLVRTFSHFPPLVAGAGGSVQQLPNGNVFVGWGSHPQFSEFTAAGRMIFNGSFALRVVSYRAFRFAWIGHPRTRPSLAVTPGPDGHVTAYASWNGATQVTRWRMLGGSTPHDLKPLDVTDNMSGFETTIGLRSEPQYFAVQALDRSGGVLKTSQTRSDPPHLAVFGSSAFVSTSGGYAGVPVGCMAGRACQVMVTVRSRGSARGHSAPQAVPAHRVGLVYLRLSAGGQHQLQNAPHRRLTVQVIARAGGLPAAKTTITLIPYSATGAGRSASTAFVSRGGRAAVLSLCYSAVPCHIDESLSVGGRVIGATGAPVSVGANEAAYIGLELNAAGRRILGQAPGNRLPAELRTRTDGTVRTTHIDLVRYG